MSHDAGGAELVSSWILHHPNSNYTFVLEGPAVAIFSRKIKNITNISREHALLHLKEFDAVLTGSGWSSDLEKLFIHKCRDNNIPVFTYLDHWVKYPDRFLFNNKTLYPNEIWVGDQYAFSAAKAEFPDQNILLKDNFYFLDLLDQIQKFSNHLKKSPSKNNILYICAPVIIVSQVRKENLGYTEFEALEMFLKYLKKHVQQENIIRLRTHPMESKDKYNEFIKSFNQQNIFETSQNTSLAEDCAWADWVVGCDSTALAIAVLANKKVFSCIPKNGRPLSVPFSEIIKIREEDVL